MTQPDGATGMKQLAEYRGSLITAASAKLVEPLDNAVATGIEKRIFEAVAGVHGHTFHDDQTNTATCARQVVGNQILTDHTLMTQRGTVWWIENPVTYPGWSELEGLQQLLIHNAYLRLK